MIRALVFSLLALALFATPAASANLYAEAALVHLLTDDASGDNTYQCSGSHIGNGVVLTAAHCVREKLRTWKGEEQKPVTVLWVDRPHDVAVLYARELAMTPSIALSCEAVPVGTEVEAIGNPFGYLNVHTFGRVANLPTRVPGRRASWEVGQFVDAIIEGGMSGGMIIDQSGRQVGLIVGGIGAIGIMVPAATVCGLMG